MSQNLPAIADDHCFLWQFHDS